MRKGAIIIENRLSSLELNLIMNSHMNYLSKDWDCIHLNLNINSLSDYNKVLTSKDFWEDLPFDKVLIFQNDSELLREGIDEFLNFDYVGAPWKFQEHGGNGGLSLRSRDAMLDVITKFPYKGDDVHGYEDVYFSNHIGNTKYKLADREVCKKFSCESIFELGSFGIHAIDKYLTKDQCNQIRNQYK